MVDALSFGRITLLALADSVNPCALAVLAMVLVSVLVVNPEKRRKVLYTGLSFVAAVYIAYLFYGIVIVQFFNTLATFLQGKTVLLYNIFAVLAMILGVLNIKDFFYYKKGSFATEMPIFLRPRVKKIIDNITGPSGGFFIGFLVTLFLLPCTMGPYIVASGLLSSLGIIGALPWLLYYNLIFVLPMLVIVFIIYFGFKKVDEVSGWRESNIKILHLIAGILLLIVGFSLLIGWL